MRAFPRDVRGVLVFLLIAGLTAATFWALGPVDRIQVEAGTVEVPEGIPDPVRLGEPTPSGFRQLLPRDAILPVYNPTFKGATSVDWSDDALVIGVELDGEAKAYPVSFLNRREMVIDWIGGTPILVSW